MVEVEPARTSQALPPPSPRTEIGHISLAKLQSVLDGIMSPDELPRAHCDSCQRLNASGDSPVYMAVTQNSPEVLTALLDRGYSPNIQSYDGDFPLWNACFRGDLDMAEMLLQYGAEINMLMGRNTRQGANYHGRGGSLLDLAISNNDVSLAQLMISRGINVNLPDATIRCPIFNAIVKNNTSIISLLLDHPSVISTIGGPHTPCPLVAAVGTTSMDIVEQMLKVGAVVNCFGDDARGEPHTPLTKACQTGLLEITKLLLEKGADPNYRYTLTANHMFPLHYAVKYPYQYKMGLDLVKSLVEHGACVNQRNQYGETPVFMAVYLSSTYVLVYLIQNGAKITNGGADSQGSYDQRSPLELAIDFGYAKIALMLAECTTSFKRAAILERVAANVGRLGASNAEAIRSKVCSVASLQALCRSHIRDRLGGSRIVHKICKLPIPLNMKGYLRFDTLTPV